MADHVKVYEEKSKGLPIWAWLLPLLLLLALLAYYLLHRSTGPVSQPTIAQTAAPVSGFPDLGTVHFDTDKATLTPEGQATLDKAAAAMKDHPNIHLRLEGYTDSTGTDPHNQSLSQQRAIAVASYLNSKGIEGSRLTGAGFGPSNPADTNATARQSGQPSRRAFQPAVKSRAAAESRHPVAQQAPQENTHVENSCRPFQHACRSQQGKSSPDL